ncbi:MAG: J domain-containing protein [Clostridia bacterium]|nr:J domain-containing protein [Clostridia bacterium]
MNPYSVLGVPDNADEETVKKAYRELVKKYHPDNYKDNPLADLANEKLQEINKAYDMIIKNKSNSSYGQSAYEEGTRSYGSSNPQYAYIRNLISQRRFNEAEAELSKISVQDAQWHFLKGCICMGKGWHFDGINHLQAAVNMDPGNAEYRNMLNSISNRSFAFNNTGKMQGYTRNSDMCSCCGNLLCADCCCEMMGGDLISCC